MCHTLEVRHVLRTVNPIALRKAKIVYNVGLSECNSLRLRECLLLIPKNMLWPLIICLDEVLMIP